MPKSRVKTRENKKKEQKLDRKNLYGNNDPTPYKAIKQSIVKKGKVIK